MRNQTTFERLKLQRLAAQVRAGTRRLVRKDGQYQAVASEDGGADEALDTAEALAVLARWNVYDKGALRNVREAVQNVFRRR